MLSALSAVDLPGGATSIQQSAIRTAASVDTLQHDTALLLAARTGSGKTLAALIPAMERAMAAERQAEEAEDQTTQHTTVSVHPVSHGSSHRPLHPLTAASSVSAPSAPPSPLPPRLLSPASLFSAPSLSSAGGSTVLCRPLSVVVVPSRELVEQQWRVGKQLSHHLPLRVERLVAGRSRAKERRDLSCAAAASAQPATSPPGVQHGVSVLVSTPGRLLSYIDRGLVSLSCLRTVVLDEADVLLSAATEGGFKDDCMRLVKLAKAAAHSAPSHASRLLFILSAASVPRSLRAALPSLFSRVLDLSSPQLHTLPPSVRLSFLPVHSFDKLERLTSLVRDIVTSHSQPRVLVFCNSLGSCRAVVAALTVHFQQQPLPSHIAGRYSHSPVLSHHGDLPAQARSSNLQAFMRGECCVLVVTDLLSRGLDLPQLSHVVQFDMSLNSTDFMHRVGRLARRPLSVAEQPQCAISLVCKGDDVLANAIAAQFNASHSIADLSSDKRHYAQL